MEPALNKSLSESNISVSMDTQHTPPNFASFRAKRSRESDYDLDFCKFKDEVKSLISSLIASQSEEIKKMSTTLMEIRNTNNNIECSMASLSLQNEELRKKVELLETKAKNDENCIVLLEDRIEDLQRGSRKANLEIKNVPRINKETRDDLMTMIKYLSNEINYPIQQSEIRDIFRVSNKRGDTKTGPIIIELSSTILKTEFLKSARSFNRTNKDKLCAKHLGLKTSETTPIYISEQLTAKGARLHFLARDLAKSKAYKYCWTAFGQVCVKKDDNSPKIIIKSEMHVNKLMQEI